MLIDLQDILVGAAVLIAGAYLLLRIRRMLRGRACGCGPVLPPKRAMEPLPDSKRQLKVVAGREQRG